MPTVKVVHLHEQGQDMIIVPLKFRLRKTKLVMINKRRDRGNCSCVQIARAWKGRVVAVWEGRWWTHVFYCASTVAPVFFRRSNTSRSAFSTSSTRAPPAVELSRAHLHAGQTALRCFQ